MTTEYTTNRMKSLIERLFKEAPKLTEEDGSPRADQAPAVECFVVLKSGVQHAGALSTTPEGMLRMMTPNERVDKRTKMVVGLVMVESFFDYEQVSSVSIQRDVKAEAEASPIIHSP